MQPDIHSSAVHSSQDLETTYMFIDGKMNTEDVIHVHNEILLSHKKELNNTICSNMDGPRGSLH